jgi:hypothetical protein
MEPNNVLSLSFLFFSFLFCGFVCRWQLPTEQPNYLASTANERRRDRNPPPMDPEKLKAVIAGYSQSTFAWTNFELWCSWDLSFSFWIVTVGKAFLAATILVFGGATAVLFYTANKLQLHSVSHGSMELEHIQVKCRTFNKKKVHPTMI